MIARHKDGDSWLFFVGEIPNRVEQSLHRFDDCFQLFFGSVTLADELDCCWVIGRVALWVIFRDGHDVWSAQRALYIWIGRSIHHPIDQMIRQRNKGWLGTSRFRHVGMWVF